MSAPAVRPTTVEGIDALQLVAEPYTATFVPTLGMLGTSLTWQGEEHLSLHGGATHVRSGHTTGMPLLHPWANRLARCSYETDGLWVDFDPLPPVALHDDLPIHGTMVGATGWVVEADIADGTRAMVQARYAFGHHPDHLRSFPFPHDLVLFIELSDLGLRVTTSITATGVRGVPVSFGWHPYFVLPGVERLLLTLDLPDREHAELDGRGLPNGTVRHEPAERALLGDGPGERLFDDAYRVVSDAAGHRRLALEGPAIDGKLRRLEIGLDEAYSHAQVYAPSGERFVALEPMTAPVNALVSGAHRTVPPGETDGATFTVRIGDVVVESGPDPDELRDVIRV